MARLGSNQEILLSIIEQYEPISYRDLLKKVREQSHTIYYVKAVVNSLLKSERILQDEQGRYYLNIEYTDEPLLPRLKGGHVDYSMMIRDATEKDPRDNGRFLRLRDEKGWMTAEDNGVDEHCDYLVLLNKTNSDIIESMLAEDDGYISFIKKIFEYEKMTHDGEFPRYDRDAVLAMVRIIDIENYTNVWRFNRPALLQMVDYIIDPGDNQFWSRLEEGKPELVDDLAAASTTDKAEARSLASKICKYFAEYILGNNDLYYINDSFVRHVLPFYFYHYLNGSRILEERLTNGSYVDLYRFLKTLHEEVEEDATEEEKIDKSRFDHILWYCYKNSGNKE